MTTETEESNIQMNQGFKLSSIDKINLCNGVLANLSIKEKLKYLKMPIIYIYSKKNCFVHLKHSDIIKRVSIFIFKLCFSLYNGDKT